MAIHINKDGKAKCGATPWSRYGGLHLVTDEKDATCKRCLGKVKRNSDFAPITENMVGKIFHTSWGYDMTINEYVKVIKQSEKSLLVRECTPVTNGGEYYPGSTGQATAGGFVKDGAQFRIFRKVKTYTDYDGQLQTWESWVGTKPGYSGVVTSWSEWDGKPDYENRLD